MFEIHRIVGIVSVVLVCAHWYVYFLKALKSFLGFWGGLYLPCGYVYCSYLCGIILNTLVGNMANLYPVKKQSGFIA